MQVVGSDGIHPHVQSSVKVKVRTYTNQSLDAATVARVSGVTIEQFVERSESFLSSINKRIPDIQTARLLALQEAGNDLDLYLVLDGVENSNSPITQFLSAHKSDIESETGLSLSNIRRNVCTAQSCSGRGDCKSQVVVGSELEYTSTSSLTLAYHRASLEPQCKCEQEYMGVDCSEEAGACRSSPCMNGAGCEPVGETGFDCKCTPAWTGNQCQTDVDECSGPVQRCMNDGR